MATPEALASQLKRAEIVDHERTLKSCEAILKKSKNDVQTKHIKAIALLKLDRYSEALEVFEKESQLQKKAALDYAYSLYRGGDPKRAAEVATGQTDRGTRHVEAQALYRAEDFVKAAAIYNDLSTASSEANDLRINRRAVEAQSLWAGLASDLSKPDRQDLEAFETAYNAACSSIAKGQFKQADILLTRSKEICKHSEELTDAEKASELLPIKMQQLYVLQKLGKTEQAEALAAEITPSEISDIATRAIASQNLLSLKPSANPYIALKSLEDPKFDASDKPFRFQSHLITHNSRVVGLQALKHEGIARSTTKVLSSKDVTQESVSAGLFNAVAHVSPSELSGKPLLNALKRELEKSPSNIGLQLAIVQLELEAKSTGVARFLEPVRSDGSKNANKSLEAAGLVALKSALLLSSGQKSASNQLLSQAALQQLSLPNPSIRLLQAAGAALLLDPTPSPTAVGTALKIFTRLQELDSKDPLTKAGLAACQASPTASSKPPKFDSDLAISLENQGIPTSSTHATHTKRPLPASSSTAPTKKRIRTSRFPKNKAELEEKGEWGQPDPERWLPLRDRKGYRAKKKRGKAAQGADRVQGGMEEEGKGKNVASAGTISAPVVAGAKKGKKKGKR